MPAYVLTVEVEEQEADDVAALLVERGASGAEVRDASLAPMPGASPLSAGRARVAAFFPSRSKSCKPRG